jgi:hypothetical protein
MTEGEAGCGADSAVMTQLLIVVAGDRGARFVSDLHCKGRQYHRGTGVFESSIAKSLRRCEGAVAEDR